MANKTYYSLRRKDDTEVVRFNETTNHISLAIKEARKWIAGLEDKNMNNYKLTKVVEKDIYIGDAE